jgi:hypothetical protein
VDTPVATILGLDAIKTVYKVKESGEFYCKQKQQKRKEEQKLHTTSNNSSPSAIPVRLPSNRTLLAGIQTDVSSSCSPSFFQNHQAHP